MNDLTSKWVVHVLGPDDVLPQPDELTALREANAINASLQYIERTIHTPFVMAIAKDASEEEV